MNTLPSIKSDFAQWYQEVIYKAKLVDQSPVKGSMVVMPYGCALWENIQKILNDKIVATGHQNALFPLFIPQSFLAKEADHVAGFAPELAVVTHAGGKELEEPLVVRPTSETMIHYMFARWIKSWRDLPIKINQWANVVRWEMRPRPFLRTTEFYWQEGHTAHATLEEAHEEVLTMLREYVDLVETYLAIPVITGKKTDAEKFPGAVTTYTLEGMMQDGKALQMGTSHLLSQSFARAFDMQFQDKNGTLQFPYLTSWGATTRLIGALVMTHGDQKGLVLPPKVAPIQVVIIPILRKGHEDTVFDACNSIKATLLKQGLRAHVDTDKESTPGAKFYHWELAGVPVRIEIGPRDLEKNVCILADRLGLVKETVEIPLIADLTQGLLDRVQKALFDQAKERQMSFWKQGDKLAEFGPALEEHGGMYQAGWCGSADCETQVKQYKATTRCILNERTHQFCFSCEKASITDLLIAKAY